MIPYSLLAKIRLSQTLPYNAVRLLAQIPAIPYRVIRQVRGY